MPLIVKALGIGAKEWCVTRGRGPRQPGGGRQRAGRRDHDRKGHGDRSRDIPMEPQIRRKRGGVGAGMPLRRSEKPAAAPRPARRSPVREVVAPVSLPQEATKVQTVMVTADEAGMRVDRFLEARFPSLSFSHIQRVIRKGELRVNGKRVDGKDRLEEGQSVRVPPLRLDAPKTADLSEAEEKTREFLRAITLYEDDDVLVLNKPLGLSVQGGSGTTRHVDGMLGVLRDRIGQRPHLVHRLHQESAARPAGRW